MGDCESASRKSPKGDERTKRSLRCFRKRLPSPSLHSPYKAAT
ncbi:UNVERIFIED_CONTAM: hypothetical protein GTU68_062036 [Idotea baltica]|nr:hypothetical protein [Idotea baltica]